MSKSRKKPSAVDALSDDLLARVRGEVLARNPEQRRAAVLAAVEELWREGTPATSPLLKRRTGVTEGPFRTLIAKLIDDGDLVREGLGRKTIFLPREMYEAAMGAGKNEG